MALRNAGSSIASHQLYNDADDLMDSAVHQEEREQAKIRHMRAVNAARLARIQNPRERTMGVRVVRARPHQMFTLLQVDVEFLERQVQEKRQQAEEEKRRELEYGSCHLNLRVPSIMILHSQATARNIGQSCIV